MMMEGAAAKKEGGRPLNIDFLHAFVHSSPDTVGDVCFVSPTAAARKGEAKGKRRREKEEDGKFMGMSNEKMLRDIAEMSDVELRDIAGMSDGELQEQIAGLRSFGRLLGREKRERRERFLPLLEKEARRRRILTDATKDGDACNRGARPSDKSVYTFDSEDERTEDDSRKYFRKSDPIRSTNENYGQLGVQTRRSSNQTGARKPIAVDKMYSSKTYPTALSGHKQRVRAVGPKEHDNEKSWQNENNYSLNYAKRYTSTLQKIRELPLSISNINEICHHLVRKARHEDSSLPHQMVNDVVLLDDEDVQPDEPVDCGVLDKWNGLKIYYPSSDDPEAVELSSSDIRCLNPGVYLSSPVINYYIQYIKRASMHIEDGTDKFYMFNTYFYSKLQEALLDKGKFLKLRRWWKGVNIFQRGYIILPIHGTSHWSLIIVCIPAKESNSGPIILHLDSLGMHPSAEIFDTVERYLEEEWRHLRKNPPSDISISDTIWQDLPRNIHKEKVEVPGQNNAYDCGVFMLYYIRQFIREAPERFTRDNLDMFSRSWFRSEVASDLRKTIRAQLLKLFGNARVDDVMSEAAASDGSGEECVIKGEPEAVTPRESSEVVVVGGDSSTHNKEGVMEVKSLEGTPSTTCRSDGRIGDCALSEAATLSESVKDDDDDTMRSDSDSSKTEQDIGILPSDSSKNNEEVIHRAPDPDMYCADSCDSDVEEVDLRSWKAKAPRQTCQIG